MTGKHSTARSHQDPTSGKFVLFEMSLIQCCSTFRLFEPLPDYRQVCPFTLVICHGEHSHPVPLPSKTPPAVREEIFRILRDLGPDLADTTACQVLRHPTVI